MDKWQLSKNSWQLLKKCQNIDRSFQNFGMVLNAVKKIIKTSWQLSNKCQSLIDSCQINVKMYLKSIYKKYIKFNWQLPKYLRYVTAVKQMSYCSWQLSKKCQTVYKSCLINIKTEMKL